MAESSPRLRRLCTFEVGGTFTAPPPLTPKLKEEEKRLSKAKYRILKFKRFIMKKEVVQLIFRGFHKKNENSIEEQGKAFQR